MAKTTNANVATSIPEIWAKRVLRTHSRSGFWGRFVGAEGSGAALIQKSELVGKPGDTIHIQTTAPLSGAGVTGDETQLEGNEENLTTSEFIVVPESYRHAVRRFRRASKKTILDLREESRMRLAEWGEVKMDSLRFANFTSTANLNGAAYTANEYFANGRADVDDLVAGDGLSVEELQKISLKLYNQQAKPLRVDGSEYFVLVAHQNCIYGLKRESEYQQWVREAHVRGADNPMFRGATAVIDGIILFQHSRVPVAENANAAPVDVATNIAFGAEAFVEGLDESATWDEETFDYGNELGVAYGFAFQPRRALSDNSVLVYAEAETPAGV